MPVNLIGDLRGILPDVMRYRGKLNGDFGSAPDAKSILREKTHVVKEKLIIAGHFEGGQTDVVDADDVEDREGFKFFLLSLKFRRCFGSHDAL